MENSNSISKNYFVCLLDVLGFKNKFETIGLQEIYKQYEIILANTKEVPYTLGVFSGFGGSYLKGRKTPSIEYKYFSDTLVFWTDEIDEETNNENVLQLTELICKSIEMNFPLRGAISFGEAIMDSKRNIFIGKPIIDCSLTETSQVWIGVTICNKCNFRITSSLLLPYSRHMKPDKLDTSYGLVFDYPKHWRKTRKTSLKEKLHENMLSQVSKSDEEKFHINRYYENSIEFCNFSESLENVDWAPNYLIEHNKRNELKTK